MGSRRWAVGSRESKEKGELGTIDIANMLDGPRLYWLYLLAFLPGLGAIALRGFLWPLRARFIRIISRCIFGIAVLYLLQFSITMHNWGILWSEKPFVPANPIIQWFVMGAVFAVAVLLFWGCKKITCHINQKNHADGSGRAVH